MSDRIHPLLPLLALAVACGGITPDDAPLASEEAPPPPAVLLDTHGIAVQGQSIDLAVTLPVPPAPPDGVQVFVVRGQGLGAGPCPAVLRGQCLDVLGPPEVLGSARTVGGVATLPMTVPVDPTLGELHLQAVVIGPQRVFLSAPIVVPVLPPTLELSLPLGVELFETSGAVALDLPPDFFLPGSEPFVGEVRLTGAPVGTAGPFELGTTDTVIERLGEGELQQVGDVLAVPVQLVELSLVGVQPIAVRTTSGVQQWEVALRLQPGPTPRGALSYGLDGPQGGLLEAELPVRPVLVFRRGAASVEWPLPEVALAARQGVWTPPVLCDVGALGVPGLPLGVCGTLELRGPGLELDLAPPQLDPTRPPALVAPGAQVDPGVHSLGRGAVIEAGAAVGPQAVVGPNAVVGAGAVVGRGAQLGAGAVLRPGAQVAAGAVVGAGAVIEGSAVVEQGAVVGAEVRLGARVRVAQGAYVGTGAQIGPDSQIGVGAQVGDGVELPVEVWVADGVRIAGGYVAAPGEVVREDLVLGQLPGGALVVATALEHVQWGSAIQDEVRALALPMRTPAPDQRTEPIDPAALPTELQDLGDDVDAAGVAPQSNGGTAPNYEPDTNDCDDFAERLEEHLEDAGYHATFTVIFEVDATRSWWEFWRPKLINGHCLTDVHVDGRTIWIEAQRTAGRGAIGVDLDRDGDGEVSYDTTSGSEATDGNLRVEVYQNRAEAEAARGPLD